MYLDYFETFTITLILLSIFIGGIVKGSVGIGMSMFSVPIIAFILPPTKAMMILCFPVIVTNFVQMNIKQGISNYRFLPMFLLLFIGILIGGKLILKLNFQTIKLSIEKCDTSLDRMFLKLVRFMGECENKPPRKCMRVSREMMIVCSAVGSDRLLHY